MTDFNINKIHINEEYANLVPPYTPSEYETFKQDIRQNGLKVPITVNRDGVILDGHHRYRICKELEIPIDNPLPIRIHNEDKLEEKLYVINVNLNRRQNLTLSHALV